MLLSERELFLNHLAQTSDAPVLLEIIAAKGCNMYDKNGKKYIDMISGIAVSNVGHAHPKVVKAVQKQSEKYMHLMVYGEYIQSPQVQFAKALSDSLPEGLESIYFVNSGSEAIEGAMKLAKRYTGRSQIIACKDAYHGSTHGALSLESHEEAKRNFRPLLPDINHIEFNQLADLQLITNKTAAVFIEPIQGEGGINIPTQNYLTTLRERCNETGTLLVYDEVQTGFGRTGKFWALEHFGVVPDILVCAKGMGGGMPLGAFIASAEVMHVLTYQPVLGHITTFGGHPVCCAAGFAALKVIKKEKLLTKMVKKEALFRKLLVHDKIVEVRGKGLMLAVEFESSQYREKVVLTARSKGLIIDWFLFRENSIRLAPPLVIKKKEIRQACKILMEVIEEIENKSIMN
jgi:acetylornithine/succinyldiaminopimelate/putrescine aminotransferase